MDWITIISILFVSVCGAVYGIKLAVLHREPLKPFVILFLIFVVCYSIMKVYLLLNFPVSGVIIILVELFLLVILVFTLCFLISYSVVNIFRYIKSWRLK